MASSPDSGLVLAATLAKYLGATGVIDLNAFVDRLDLARRKADSAGGPSDNAQQISRDLDAWIKELRSP